LDNTRGLRYCEVIVATKGLEVSVYNTINLNNCPADLWNKLSTDDIKKETDAFFVHLNGPRYFVFDAIENASLINKTEKMFGGINMREAGVLHITPQDLMNKSKPYSEHQVDRKTTWVYLSGKPVYELVSPEGEVFVMQSYSIQQTPQTEASLATLGKRLTLPKGWHFYTGTPSKTEKVTAIDGHAFVITDDFLNTYQKATHDLLTHP
jgi:hypothetical protein